MLVLAGRVLPPAHVARVPGPLTERAEEGVGQASPSPPPLALRDAGQRLATAKMTEGGMGSREAKPPPHRCWVSPPPWAVPQRRQPRREGRGAETGLGAGSS